MADTISDSAISHVLSAAKIHVSLSIFELGLPQKALDSSLDMTDVGVLGPES